MDIMKFFVILFSLIFSIIPCHSLTIEIVSPHAPGGPTDAVARIVQSALNDPAYKIVYKPGATSQIGIRYVNENDSLLVYANVQTFISTKRMNTDVKKIVENDLEPIVTIGIMPSLLFCNSATGIKTFQDLKNYDKILSFGTTGEGSVDSYLTDFMLSTFPNKHVIVQYPQAGSKPILDLMGNHINCMFVNYTLHNKNIGNPKLSPIIISHNIHDGIPVWDSIFSQKFQISNIIGLAVSKNLSSDLREKIIKDVKRSFTESFQRDLKKIGLIPYVNYSNIKSLDEETISFLKKNNLF